MIDELYIANILASNYLSLGASIALTIGTIIGATVALFGLGYGLQKLYLTLGNFPGGFGYNPAFGSGISRFQKGRRNSSGGVNLLSS